MAKARKRDPKSEALAQDGVLNPNPEIVRDELFAGNPFFDAKDLVQVRYEMVRRHQVDGVAISEAAATFGVTRPTFYKAQNALQTAGLTGLLPGRRGPRDGHKASQARRLSLCPPVDAPPGIGTRGEHPAPVRVA
jgi:Helix-turn-helix domain